MKKLILALAATLAVASCNQGASDGYFFEKDTQPLSPEREIHLVLYPNLAEVNAAFQAQSNSPKLAGDRELQAFSVITDETCTIHMIDPAVKYMPEFFGHELVHCLYGEFHPGQNGQ